jgi:4-hydroxyphenylacetate 3-monooxygenase
MPKSGAEHLVSLQDGRQIFLDGAPICDHVNHPAFQASIASAAKMFDFQAAPENQSKMTFVSPKSGERVSRMWELPTCHQGLLERRKALEAWAELSCGFLGRSPDHVASALSAMYMGRHLFGERGARALADYYEFARDNDLYLTYAIISPQADRSKSAGEQSDEFLAAGIVDEDAEGITIRGAKMLATAIPMANEVMIAAIQPLKPGEEKYSFTAMVPMSAKGLKLLSRKSFEASAVSVFDNPLSSTFDENDSVLYLNDVKIPWARVFVHNDIKLAQAQWHSTPAHVYQNYQCQIRLAVKMRFLLGLARKIAETNGIVDIPPVRELLGQMAAEASMVQSMLEAMEFSGTHYGPYFIPNGSRLYSAMVLTQQLYPKFIGHLRELSGGGMIMLPSSVSDFANEEIAGLVTKTQRSPTTDAKGRVKLFKLAWDAVGSEFGSRHLQYEMFYAGANMVTRGHAFRTADWGSSTGMVDRFMETYDLAGRK